jgi:1-acyl-sn-glycerol-3-phosphate acyltransferase
VRRSEGAANRERTLFRELRLLDRHELRRVLIFVRGLLLAAGDAPAASNGSNDETVSYRLESVKCGKPGCKSCPHGPYWYAYFREGKRLRSRYIGKILPDDAAVPADTAE